MPSPLLEHDELDVERFWNDWLDFTCVCGFPHPKPGNQGAPPTLVEFEGQRYLLPHYPGVMGGDFPVEEMEHSHA